GVTARAVGMTRNLDDGLLELVQHDRDGVQHLVEARVQVRAVGREGDVAGHVQRDVVADARDADAGAIELLPQAHLLAIHVGSHARAGQGAQARTDQRTLLALHRAIARDETRDGARGGADHGLALRARRALLPRI